MTKIWRSLLFEYRKKIFGADRTIRVDQRWGCTFISSI